MSLNPIIPTYISLAFLQHLSNAVVYLKRVSSRNFCLGWVSAELHRMVQYDENRMIDTLVQANVT